MLINELLNIKYPIIGGAMANISTGKFAASISNAGGLGIIAGGALTAEALEKEILECQRNTTKPFGVNIMLMNPHVEEVVSLVCKYKVPVVTTGAGNPGTYMQQFIEAGIKVFPVVPSVALAKRLTRYPIAGIIAEGTESGGHVGETTTMALLPQVIEAVNLPVIAAGGIACGKQLNAALALGAVGIQIGTILLSTEECPVHPNYKQVIVNAKDTDTTVTGRSLGAPVRIYKNKMARSYIALEQEAANRDALEQLTLGGLRKAVRDGDMENGSVMMGQVAGIIHEIKTIEKTFSDLIAEAKQEKESLDSKIEALIYE